MITEKILLNLGVKPEIANVFIEPLQLHLPTFELTTDLRVQHFIAQALHESNYFRSLRENLNYTPIAILKTFNKKVERFTKQEAEKYGRTKDHAANQKMIGNIAYGNRNGNGDWPTGDGYFYRGRGIFQITGKDNYFAFGKYATIDCLSDPELLTIPNWAVLSACWYWETRNLNQVADTDNVEKVTKIINGGLNNIDERKALLVKCKRYI